MDPAANPAQIRMDAIRNRVALAAMDWGVTAGETFCLTVGEGDGVEIVATFSPAAGYDDMELICHAPDDLRWLLETYDRLALRYRQIAAELDRIRPKPKDFAAECAMKCGDHLFRRFLRDVHGLEATDNERVVTRVRSILAIQSRSELNTDEAAQARWRSLVAEFDRWRKR